MGYCTVAECERESSGHGELCVLHLKRKQRGKDLHAPEAETDLSPMERALIAGDRLVRAPSEDDDEYERRRRAFISACRVVAKAEGVSEEEIRAKVEAEIQTKRSEEYRQRFAAAKARGVQLGRPPKLDCEKAAKLIEKAKGNISRAAKLARVDRATMRAALRSCGVKFQKVHQHPCPRAG